MAKPAVIVVGADKGGVGKTTVSRTILDYFSANNVPTRAFDTESPRGTLRRFHPDVTEIVDMTTTADQMKIFDTLGNGTEPLLGTAPPQNLADAMHAAWVAFATNGDCGWPRYDPSRRATMRFDTRSEVVDDPRSAERALWEGVR